MRRRAHLRPADELRADLRDGGQSGTEGFAKNADMGAAPEEQRPRAFNPEYGGSCRELANRV